MNAGRNGSRRARIKVVRRKLADGTIREYRYDRDAKMRERFAVEQGHALRKIIREFYGSPEFATLSPRYQYEIRHYSAIAEERLGWMTFDDLQNRRARGEFYRLRDAFADRPPTADRVISILASLLSWAYERGMIETNHATRMERLSPARPRADRIWSDDEIAAYIAACEAIGRADLGRLFQFALYTAARQSDLVALSGEQLRDGWLSFRPSKTSNSTAVLVELPTFELPPLASLLQDAPHAGPLLLTREGDPWTPTNVRKWHARVIARARIDDLRWHDLRGTALSRMLAAGATEAEAASITGHHLVGQSAMRAYAARTRALAQRAYQAWARSLSGGEVIHVEFGAGKRAGK